MRRGLIRLFMFNRVLRMSALATAVSAMLIVQLAGAVTALRPDAVVQADQLVGASKFLISMPSSAPLGLTDTAVTERLAAAVRTASGGRVGITYLLSRVRPDLTTAKYFQLRQSSDPTLDRPAVRLIRGRWPRAAGEAALSVQGDRSIGPRSTVSFFGGALRVHIVGVFYNDLSRNETSMLLGPGTWESTKVSSASEAKTLSISATRNFYSTGARPVAALRQLQTIAASIPSLQPSVRANPAQLQTRSEILELHLSPIFQLSLGSLLLPLLVGLIAGTLGGCFIGRMRRVLWTLGIPHRRTRFPAIIAVIGLTSLGAVSGVVLGLCLLPATLLLANVLSDHRLSGQHGLLTLVLKFVSLAIGASILGLLIGTPSVHASRTQAALKTANLRLVGLLAFVAFAVVGVNALQGNTDSLSISIAGASFSAALMLFVSPLLNLLLKIEPRSTSLRLAFRRARADAAVTGIAIYTIGLLTVLGVGLAAALTSTAAAVNARSISAVPPGQIVLAPELTTNAENVKVAETFSGVLQLGAPVVVYSADQGSDDGDGATAIVNSVSDVTKMTGAQVSRSNRAFFNDGGILVSTPHSSSTTHFSVSGTFRGATFKNRFLPGANASFKNWDGIVLAGAAKKGGLKLESPRFVFTNTSQLQRASVPRAVAQLHINPSWVQTYRAPDTLLPPVSYFIISGVLLIIAGFVAFIVASMDVRSMRPSTVTLLALGVRRSFVLRMLLAKTAIITVAATAGGAVASLVGSSLAFSFGRLTFPLVLPVPEIALQCVVTATIAVASAVLGTARLTSRKQTLSESLARQ